MLYTETVQAPTPARMRPPYRGVLSIVLFLLAVWSPWWLALMASIVCILLFTVYELLFIGFFLDSLYAMPSYHTFHVVEFPYTVLLLVCISISLIIRHILRRV